MIRENKYIALGSPYLHSNDLCFKSIGSTNLM